MEEKKRNFYTVKEVREIVFSNNLSATTLHKLIRAGEIPSETFCSKKLIPAWWVEEKIKQGRGVKEDNWVPRDDDE